MIITIHQPEYLPWIGFFDRIIHSDIFVVLDHVQYQRGFVNRNKIKTSKGASWLTVPINQDMHRSEINKVTINNEVLWGDTHWKSIFYNYAKAPYFNKYSDIFQTAYNKKWEKISDLDLHFIDKILQSMHIKTKIYKSSSLNVEGKASDLLINICKKVKADTYLSGQGGKRYMDMAKFKDAGIKVLFQEFDNPVYRQLYTKEQGFISQLSIIDFLLNCGDESMKILMRK